MDSCFFLARNAINRGICVVSFVSVFPVLFTPFGVSLPAVMWSTHQHSFSTQTSKFGELWSPARQQLWPWRRSKVKVTAWRHLKGLVTRIMHAKYQWSIFNTSEDMSQVKVFVTDRRTDGGTEGRTDRQTDEWDLMSPRFRESGGQK